MEIKRVMMYIPMEKSPNILGGYNGNTISSSYQGGNVIAGGGWSTLPNAVSGEFSTVSGGAGNTAVNGGFVGGGGPNYAAEEGAVAGGAYDSAGYLAFVGGGISNKASYAGSIGGGSLNDADTVATVGGGSTNKAFGKYSTISGGLSNNTTGGSAMTIGGGYSNLAEGDFSTIGGGYFNVDTAFSAIPGGYSLQLTTNSFGFNGRSTNPAATVISATNVAYFGNVDLEIGSNDATARQLRIFVPNSTTVYSSFEEPVGTSGIPTHYVLPGFQATATGQVLTNDGIGNLSWGPGINSGAGGAWLTAGNRGTTPPTNFIGTLDSEGFEIHLFDTVAATGTNKRVMGYYLGKTSPNLFGGSSGNLLGSNLSGAAVLSGGSLVAPNTVLDSFSLIAGGSGNVIDSFADHSNISGGDSNLVDSTADHSTISGGGFNYTGAKYAFVGGGGGPALGGPFLSEDFSSSDSRMSARLSPMFSSLLGSWLSNMAAAPWTTIGAGFINRALDTLGSVLGGALNIIYLGGVASTIGGGYSNFVEYARLSTIGGGYGNVTDDAPYSTISGGFENQTVDTAAVIAGGVMNYADGAYSAIGGGQNNEVDGNNAVVAGGLLNNAFGSYSFIGAGYSNADSGIGTECVV
ncbi:MAG TPA: hypothetical protein VGM92_07040, partial [Candidatus Kapabacteria bacterium]